MDEAQINAYDDALGGVAALVTADKLATILPYIIAPAVLDLSGHGRRGGPSVCSTTGRSAL
jgi:hypothetical protein